LLAVTAAAIARDHDERLANLASSQVDFGDRRVMMFSMRARWPFSKT
jgi:hypothetical protein